MSGIEFPNIRAALAGLRADVDALKRIKPSPSGGALSVTDGTDTVDPTTEVSFAAGLDVTDIGGGTAGVTPVNPIVLLDTANAGGYLEADVDSYATVTAAPVGTSQKFAFFFRATHALAKILLTAKEAVWFTSQTLVASQVSDDGTFANTSEMALLQLQPSNLSCYAGKPDTAELSGFALVSSLFATPFGIQFTLEPSGTFQLWSGTDGFALLEIDEAGETRLKLRTGKAFKIQNHLGADLFVFNENGSYTLDGGGP